MVVVNVFWLLPNIWLIAKQCSWFDTFISWCSFTRWAGLFLVRRGWVVTVSGCVGGGMDRMRSVRENN